MVADFQREGLKEFYPADVTIDGQRIERVGLRLKGNSTLFGLLLGDQMGRLAADMAEAAKQRAKEGKPPFRIGRPLPEALQPKMPAAGSQPPPAPTTINKLGLPYLLQFDEFVPGQRYQGLRQLALRGGGGPTADYSLQPEILTSRLLLDAGQPTTRQAYTGLSFNGEAEKLFLVTEVPDDELAARSFPGRDGVMYKANTGAPFRYLGSDQTDYADWYETDSGVRRHDLAPLIAFIRWVEESSDAEFAAGIADRLDIEAFAGYLAVHNILANADSLGGIGNNYYLWYDLGTRRFAPVSWDVNGSLGRITLGAEPERYDPYYRDEVSFGAFGGPPPKLTEHGAIKLDFGDRPGFSVMKRLMPEGGELGNNLLRQRFFKAPALKEAYEEIYRRLYDRLLASGHAASELQRLTAVVSDAVAERPSLIKADEFELLAETNLRFLDDRAVALAGMEPVSRPG
jgi:spore coat protein CotH